MLTVKQKGYKQGVVTIKYHQVLTNVIKRTIPVTSKAFSSRQVLFACVYDNCPQLAHKG